MSASNTAASAPSTRADELVCGLAPGSRIKLVGLGGVGSIVLAYLSLFLRNLNIPLRLTLIDGDSFEPDNERVAFKSLGEKAEVKAAEIAEHLDGSQVTVVAVAEYVNAENIDRLIRPGDHVFLCVDNHPTRRLISEHCCRLNDVVLFNGGNDAVDPPRERGTYGSVNIHVRQGAKDLTVPITRFHPEVANVEGELPGGPNCAQLAESTPQILFANLAVASAMLNAFFAYCCGRLSYQEVKFDILDARSLPQFVLQPDQYPQPLPAPK